MLASGWRLKPRLAKGLAKRSPKRATVTPPKRMPSFEDDDDPWMEKVTPHTEEPKTSEVTLAALDLLASVSADASKLADAEVTALTTPIAPLTPLAIRAGCEDHEDVSEGDDQHGIEASLYEEPAPQVFEHEAQTPPWVVSSQ